MSAQDPKEKAASRSPSLHESSEEESVELLDVEEGDAAGIRGKHSRFMPTTNLGRLSARLLAASLSAFVIAIIVSLVVDDGDLESTMDVVRPVIGLAFLITGLGSLVSATIAMVRDRERSVLAWFALLFGLFATVFVLGDIFVPQS